MKMSKTAIIKQVKDGVATREKNKTAPYHVLLSDLRVEAAGLFQDYDRAQYKKLLRELVINRQLYAGHTVNDIWISHKKHNL